MMASSRLWTDNLIASPINRSNILLIASPSLTNVNVIYNHGGPSHITTPSTAQVTLPLGGRKKSSSTSLYLGSINSILGRGGFRLHLSSEDVFLLFLHCYYLRLMFCRFFVAGGTVWSKACTGCFSQQNTCNTVAFCCE